MYCRSYMYVIVIKRTFIFVCTCTMWWRQRGWSKLCVTFISSVLNTTTYSWACSDKCNFWRIVSGILLPIFDEHSLHWPQLSAPVYYIIDRPYLFDIRTCTAVWTTGMIYLFLSDIVHICPITVDGSRMVVGQNMVTCKQWHATFKQNEVVHRFRMLIK